jgi:hypothetical protein
VVLVYSGKGGAPIVALTQPEEITMKSTAFGQSVEGLMSAGRPVRAGVFDEHQVRAAAGLTLVFGAVAFAYAYFGASYVPIKSVTLLFFVEFLIRVGLGLQYSPVGQVARWLTRRQAPQWVSAQPKRFAWSLGLIMSLAMVLITHSNIRGGLPLTICLLCLTLMWLEAVLGLCLGCEIHRWMSGRGWVAKADRYEICTGGACENDATRQS